MTNGPTAPNAGTGGLRLAVFGTSNCFPGSSFITALGRNATVENASLGASTSICPALRLPGLDLAQFDACLLDSAINDDAAYRAGVSLDRLAGSLLSTAAQAWQMDCIPVLLIFPTRAELNGISAVRNMHLRIARDYNLPFLDVFAVLSDVARQLGLVAPRDVFKDAAHLHWWFDGNLAAFVVSALALLPRLAEPRPWPYHLFEAIDLPGRHMHDAPVVTRSSSVIQGRFLQLRPGQVLRVAVPSGTVVAGYAADFRHSHALMRVQGENETVVDLRSFYNGWDAGIVLSALHLAEEVAPSHGSVILQALLPQTRLETTVYPSHPPGRDGGKHEVVIEVSHLVVRHLCPSVADSRPARAMHLDLWQLASPQARALLLTRTREHLLLQRQKESGPPG